MPNIHDVEVRDLQVSADQRDHLVEVFRSDWGEYEINPEMSYYSMTCPGVVRAWHRHLESQIDHFVCPEGRITVGIYDDREDSPTQGELDTFIIGEHNQQVIRIPGDCWHGFKAIGDEPSLLINYPTNLYDCEDPDEERIPYDDNRIPYNWNAEIHSWTATCQQGTNLFSTVSGIVSYR